MKLFKYYKIETLWTLSRVDFSKKRQKRRHRKSLFTCKKVLKNLKFHNFCYNNDNYLKFLAFVYFLTKENTCEVSIK